MGNERGGSRFLFIVLLDTWTKESLKYLHHEDFDIDHIICDFYLYVDNFKEACWQEGAEVWEEYYQARCCAWD